MLPVSWNVEFSFSIDSSHSVWKSRRRFSTRWVFDTISRASWLRHPPVQCRISLRSSGWDARYLAFGAKKPEARLNDLAGERPMSAPDNAEQKLSERRDATWSNIALTASIV
eukprot:3107450-Rhodomonas_salina.1